MAGTGPRTPDTGTRTPDPGFLDRVEPRHGHGLEGTLPGEPAMTFLEESRRR